MVRKTALYLCILGALLLSACDMERNAFPGDTGEIRLSIAVPDFHGRTVAPSAIPQSRVISPDAQSIRLTVSAVDLDDIVSTVIITRDRLEGEPTDHLVYSYLRDDDPESETMENPEYCGFTWTDVTIDDIPSGWDRTITADIYDMADPDDPSAQLIASGSTTIDIHLGFENDPYIRVYPSNPTDLALTDAIPSTGIVNSSVQSGKMTFFNVDLSDLSNKALLQISVESAFDVDTYLFDDNASYTDVNNFWIADSGNETALFPYKYTYTTDFFYVGVYGYDDSQTDLPFSLSIGILEPASFASSPAVEENTPSGIYNSILSNPRTQAVLNEREYDDRFFSIEPKDQNDMPFSFTVHGDSIDRFYISTSGQVTFQPYGAWDPVRSSSSYFEFDLPSDLVGLYSHRLELRPQETENRGIYYLVEGTAPNRTLTIEYAGMEHYTDPDQLLYGQIQFHESDNSVELLYDRSRSTIDSDGFVGYLNEDRSIKAVPTSPDPDYPGFFPTIPEKDFIIGNLE